jgi:hypothetical protein
MPLIIVRISIAGEDIGLNLGGVRGASDSTGRTAPGPPLRGKIFLAGLWETTGLAGMLTGKVDIAGVTGRSASPTYRRLRLVTTS